MRRLSDASIASSELQTDCTTEPIETKEQWQERSTRCLECGKEARMASATLHCSECGNMVLRSACRRRLDEVEREDAELAQGQERAQQSLDFRRALNLAAARLRLAQERGSSLVPTLLLEMSSIFGALGDLVRRGAYAEKALSLFRQVGQSQGMAMALCVLGQFEQERGRLDSGLRRCREGLSELATYDDHGPQNKVELTMGHLLETSGLFPQALEQYRRLTRAEGGTAVRMGAILGLGRCLLALGEYQTAFACFEDALEVAAGAAATQFRLPLALSQAALFVTVRDAKLAGDCLAWAEGKSSAGDAGGRIELAILKARHAMLLNQWMLAERFLESAADQATRHPVTSYLAWTRYYQAVVHRAQGRLDESRASAQLALERAQSQGLRELCALCALLLVDQDASLANSAEGEGLIRRAHAQAKELRLPELLWRTSLAMATLCAEQNNDEMEERYLTQARGVLEEMRQKAVAFRRGSYFFGDPDKLRFYQHWAQRMLAWDQRKEVEVAAYRCAEPALARALEAVLQSA